MTDDEAEKKTAFDAMLQAAAALAKAEKELIEAAVRYGEIVRRQEDPKQKVTPDGK